MAQVTTAKPASPSLDTGETHFPDHLWLLNEGTGTALEDDGDHTDHDLTCAGDTGGGPDWGTDGTHGDILTFVPGNVDRCANSSVSSLTGVQTSCAVTDVTAGTGARAIMAFSDNSTTNRYAESVIQGNEDVEARIRFGGGSATTNASTQQPTFGWDLICIRWDDTKIDWSLNGSNWDTDTSGTFTGLLAAINTVALGARIETSVGSAYEGSIAAAWWWHADKDNTAISAIYNSGNPWPIIGVDVSAAATFTAGPTVGTVTTTTIPLTGTSDTNGTWVAVACPDGQTFPTVAQVLAGDCTGDVAAEATFSQAVVATVGDGDTLSGLDPGTTYDVHSVIDATTDSALYTNANVTTNALPTFSSGPSAGGTGGTTITVNFTSDQTGDVYGVACPDGQAAPTVAQVKAGDCTGDVAAEDAFTQAVVASVADTDTFTGLANSTTYDTHFMIDSTVNGDSAAIASLANQTTTAGSGPEFTSGPSVASATNGFTISGTITCTGTCTVEAVACNPGDAAPSNAELEAGQCGGGNAALMNASEAWTTATPDSFLLTSANKPARFDVYVAGTDGTNDTTVIEFANQNRSADSGQTIAVLSSIATTSIFDLDPYFDPDVTAGDVVEHDSDTNEDAGCSVAFEADGDFTLTPDAAGDCDGKRTFDISYQDVSSATTGLFTAPTAGNFTTDDLVCNGNTAPESEDPFEVPMAWTVGESIDPIDLSAYFSDADGDSLTFTLTTGSWPAGVSQSGTGNKDVTGTPTVEDEAGIALVVTATDNCGDTATYSFYSGTAKDFYVIDTWAVPNLDNLDFDDAATAVIAAAPWRAFDPGVVITGYDCGTGQDFLNIATQDPAFGGEVGAYEDINVELVGAILPDLTGMTEAEAVAAIEAVCP